MDVYVDMCLSCNRQTFEICMYIYIYSTFSLRQTLTETSTMDIVSDQTTVETDGWQTLLESSDKEDSN